MEKELDDDKPLPEIVIPMVVCPQCGSDETKTRTSRLRANGARVSYCECPDCE